MRTSILYFILFIVSVSLLGSCHENNPRIENQMDSASAMIYTSSCSIACQMLDSLLKDTNEMPQKQKMKLLLTWIHAHDVRGGWKIPIEKAQSLVDYYSDHAPKSMDMFRSYYYLAGAYRDNGDYPMAVETYNKAIEVSKDCDCVDSVLSKVYFQLSNIYNDLYQPHNALECSFKLLSLDISNNLKASCLCNIGTDYSNLEMYDSAAYYYNAAYNLPCDEDEKVANGQYQIGFFILHKDTDNVRKRVADLYNCGKIDTINDVSLFEGRACYFEFINQLDSAQYYWKIILDKYELEYRQLASMHLNQIAASKGEWKLAQYYSDLYQEYTIAVMRQTESLNTAQVKQQYEYNAYRQKSEAAEREKIKNRYMLYIVSILLVAAVMVGLSWYRIFKRKKELDLVKLMRAKSQVQIALDKEQKRAYTLIDNIENMENQMEQLQQTLHISTDENQETMKKLDDAKQRIEGMKAELEQHSVKESELQDSLVSKEKYIGEIERKLSIFNKQKKDFADEMPQLYNRILDMDGSLPLNEWKELFDAANELYPFLHYNMENLYPDIQKIDQQVIYLACCGFNNKKIMELLKLSYQLVNVKKKRVCEKMLNKSNVSAEESNAFIKSLVNECIEVEK